MTATSTCNYVIDHLSQYPPDTTAMAQLRWRAVTLSTPTAGSLTPRAWRLPSPRTRSVNGTS